jgi:hypothetical protein
MLANLETLAYDSTKVLLVILNPRASAEDETKLFQKHGWIEVPEHEYVALFPPSPRLKESNKLHKTHSGTSIDSGHHTAEANEDDSSVPPATTMPVHKRVYRLADGRADDRRNSGIQVTIEHVEEYRDGLTNQHLEQTVTSASSSSRSCIVV